MTDNTRIITIHSPGFSMSSQVEVHTAEGDLAAEAVAYSWITYKEILDALRETGYIDEQTEIFINDHREKWTCRALRR